jgi:flagellar biosynthetic protein FliR
MYINLDRYLVFMLVMLRMTGLFVLNPIFSRVGVPAMVNMGLAFVIAICIVGARVFPSLPDVNLFSFFYFALKELAVGMVAGFVIRMFLSVFVVGGEVIDMHLGIGMAKAFDPQTNASVSISAQLLNIMFTVGFFSSNTHLTLIQMTAKTFDIVPLGELSFNPGALYALPELYTLIFLLSIKLCMPVIVMEGISTFAVGMVMRVIPQINIFVVQIQLKLMLGLLVMIMLVPAFSGFCENVMFMCLENIQDIWLKFV